MAQEQKKTVQPEGDPGRYFKREDTATIKTIADQAKEMASTRERIERATGNPANAQFVTPLVVLPEHSAQAYDAKNHLETAVAEKKAEIQADIEAEQAEYLFFYRCRTCGAHALYFSQNPSRLPHVGQKDWYAAYKKTDEVYSGTPICQVCLMKTGQENDVGVVSIDRRSNWVPEPRWIFQRAKNIERLKIEGEFRAVDLQYASANTGRQTAMKRWADHLEAKQAAPAGKGA